MDEHSKLPWRDPGEHELTGYGDINHVILSADGKLVGSLYANCFSVEAMSHLPTLKEAAGNAALIVNSAATISILTAERDTLELQSAGLRDAIDQYLKDQERDEAVNNTLRAERDALKHDIDRHLSIMTEMQTERDGLRAALQAMLVDPPATRDEPDTDAEVIIKMREIARATLATPAVSDAERAPQTNVNECPSCKRMFADGETCMRGGCPMGGDV